MAGLFQLSLHQILDDFGQPLHGNLTFFYETGTLEPLPVFTDYGCTVPAPNPVPADGFGRIPTIYIADGGSGFYRFRVTTAEGAIVPGLDLQTLPVLTPGIGGGPPPTSPVDPDTLVQTGDVIFAMRTGPRNGFVRANGGSIGNAASGASERANADCAALFAHFYAYVIDGLCPVSGGRSGNATTDFTAGKRLTLPDLRGRAPYGIDGMGRARANRLTASTITTTPSGGPDVVASFGGVETVFLTIAQLAAHTHSAGTYVTDSEAAHSHGAGTLTWQSSTATGGNTNFIPQASAGGAAEAGTFGVAGATTINGAHSHVVTGTSGSAGSTSFHNNLSPALLGCWYTKL